MVGGNVTTRIAPTSIIIPVVEPVSTIANPSQGHMAMSGAMIYAFDGTDWRVGSGATIMG